jgi:hypothetical protein
VKRLVPTLLGAWLLVPSASRAADPLDPGPPPPPPAPAPKPKAAPMKLEVTPEGYVEAYFAWNANRPSNGITNYRGFDNRHATFSLTNVAAGGTASYGPVYTRILFQVGSTGSTYYLNEPANPGSSGANASDTGLWKYLQEAYLGVKLPVFGRTLSIDGGLFLSPLGIENMAVKDNWNWSRSILFYGLPFYHAGVRATLDLGGGWSTLLHANNGWNSVVDNNEAKSIAGELQYTSTAFTFDVTYFAGIERPTNAPEGQYWRQQLDAWAKVRVLPRLEIAFATNGGFEPNRFGTSSWLAFAAYGRVTLAPWAFLAVRADNFRENIPSNELGTATPIFWNGVRSMSSATATFEVRGWEHISLRLEYRHDAADRDAFFAGKVSGDGTTAAPYVANAKQQDTLLVGATAWF